MFKRNPQFIVHLNGDSGIPPIPIFEKRFIVGRKPTHPVPIPDNSISRDHLEVIFQENQIFVMDLGTSNGTRIDNQRIPSNMPTPYHEGQMLYLGHSNVSMTIEIFSEDREKRKNNPSAKAIQNQQAAQARAYQPFPDQQQSPAQQLQNQQAFQAAVQQGYQTPVQQVPVQQAYQAPVQQAPVQQAYQAPVQQAPVQQAYQAPVQQAPVQQVPVQSVPVQSTSYASPDSAPVSQQTREDANRIIAKAKIEAEMAARDLMRSKESEAQQILQQAESKALEKVRDAEGQVQNIIQQANSEAQKIKESLLEDAKREKDRVLATVNAEKEYIQRDIETLKQTIPSLTGQIDQLKIQIQKHQTEKVSSEAQFTQETIRLEKLLAEIRTHELQLKNIQQQLELNQIKANEAEEKYKATVLANQNLIEETNAALERAKIKDAELSKLIESAKTERDSAVDFAKEHRSDAESYAKVMREEADNYSKVTRDETDKWSGTTREETLRWVDTTKEATELEIKRKLEHLQQETTQILAERDRVYQETKQRQETILDELKNTEALKLKNLQEIDDILKRKNEEFEVAFRQKREGLELDYNNRKQQLDKESHQRREDLERELSDRRTAIERELLERRESLERESAEKKAKIEKDAQDLRATRDKEYKELKTQQDAYLFDIKKREEDRLKAMVEESRQAIREQFNIKNENVQKSFEEFFAEYAKTANSGVREQLPTLHEQLRKILKEALTNELSGEDKQLRQLFEYDPNIEKKHKKFWIRFSIAAAVVVVIAGFILADPMKLSRGADSLSQTVTEMDKENKQKQAALLEKMKQAGIYKPDKDDSFKESYTDNILYTNRYVEFEKDEDYRSQWIVSTKEFLIQEAKLIDDKADELISKEGSLIIWLDHEVATIDGRNPEKGIMRMREKENEYVQLLTQTLNDEKRRLLKEKKQAFFERYLGDASKARGPAQTGK